MLGLVVYPDGTLKIEELPKPQINEYQALVETLSCGICSGTDFKIIHGNFKGFDTYPAILGHEGVGRVVEVAPGSILQFDKSCEDMLELSVGEHPIAAGEAIKVGDKFGLRVTSIILPEERFHPVNRESSKHTSSTS